MHAAEELLSEVRSAKRSLDTVLVAHCLECLDLVLQWLDALEKTGAFPAGADAQVSGLLQRFGPPASDSGRPGGATRDWVDELLGRNPRAGGRATAAVRFVPAPDCFYQGEDPVERMGTLPGLFAFHLEPINEWAPLEDFDPFSCNLILTALTTASLQEATDHMRGHFGTCDVLSVGADVEATLPVTMRAILEAQVSLLSVVQPDQFAGCVGSAGTSASNAALSCGRSDLARVLSVATAKSLTEQTAGPLREAIMQALTGAPKASPAPAVGATQHVEFTSRTLRVDAARVDALVRLAGELTVAKNAVGHVVKLAQDEGSRHAGVLKERHAVLEHLVGELQRAVLGIRVLPLRTVLQRFPRVVREMSAALGKSVELEIEGEETEADKAIVEMLFEPLLHTVRNALDHGVESPAVRADRGKPKTASLRIRASRQADQVLITVSDDGGGIDVERVRAVARERGLVTEDVLSTMTEAAVIDLIFAPGFSTAAKVTELSGRGVGMDAVRTAVERIGGRVTLESRAASGTTVSFSLPFSLMMTQLMTVEAGGQMFGLPLDAVMETVRVPRAAIAGVGAGHAIVLRDRTVPVVELASVVGAPAHNDAYDEAILVIAAVAGQLSAIRVDRVGERLEVILKPLEGLLTGTRGLSGTTLLGDGRVLLVLDMGGMLQ